MAHGHFSYNKLNFNLYAHMKAARVILGKEVPFLNVLKSLFHLRHGLAGEHGLVDDTGAAQE